MMGNLPKPSLNLVKNLSETFNTPWSASGSVFGRDPATQMNNVHIPYSSGSATFQSWGSKPVDTNHPTVQTEKNEEILRYRTSTSPVPYANGPFTSGTVQVLTLPKNCKESCMDIAVARRRFFGKSFSISLNTVQDQSRADKTCFCPFHLEEWKKKTIWFLIAGISYFPTTFRLRFRIRIRMDLH